MTEISKYYELLLVSLIFFILVPMTELSVKGMLSMIMSFSKMAQNFVSASSQAAKKLTKYVA